MTAAELATQGSLADRMRYAEALSGASLLPTNFQGKPADVLLAMEWGSALGMTPMQAINSIHVINGRPGLSANALAALVRREGHRMRVVGDDTAATASIWRKDDPDFEYRVTWTIDMAKTAGLLGGKGKDNWTHYPAAMLKARAQTAVVRDACPELIIGLPGDDDPADGAPDWTTTVVRDDAPLPPHDPDTGEIIDVEVVDMTPEEEAETLDRLTPQIATADLDTLRDIWKHWHETASWPHIEPLINDRKAQLDAEQEADA